MIQGAVEFDVLEAYPEIIRECLESACLAQNTVDDLIVRHFDVAPSETREVRIARMGTRHDIVFFTQAHRALHHGRVGGVHPAGDVRRGYVLYGLGIIADRICAERLSHVAVEVYSQHGDIVTSFLTPVIPGATTLQRYGVLLSFVTMKPKRTKVPARKKNVERSRTKRFLYLWVPIICLVVIGFYASALDPPRPTGKVMKGSVAEIKRSSQQPGSVLYKIRLETGEVIEIAVPEKETPAGSEVMVEEYSTTFFKKKTYEIRKNHG
jgi:hypothetical protein